MAVRRIKSKVERKVQRGKEKLKDVLGSRTPVSKASSSESLRAHSASPSNHPRASADAGEQGDSRGDTGSSSSAAQRTVSEPRVEQAGLDAEIPSTQSLIDTTNSELVKHM
jgi:hypothetical protein